VGWSPIWDSKLSVVGGEERECGTSQSFEGDLDFNFIE
jgi:hypothetical protein